jgi:hypothetical protein
MQNPFIPKLGRSKAPIMVWRAEDLSSFFILGLDKILSNSHLTFQQRRKQDANKQIT